MAQGLATAADDLPVALDPSLRAAAPPGASTARCPRCAGAVRPDAPWCTQCWTDLRPAPAPEPEPAPVRAATTAPRGPAPDGSPGAGRTGWPCSGCGTVNGVELDACVACGTGFLAGLKRDEPPLLVLPGVGDITRLSRGQRLGLACGTVLLVVLLVLVLGLLAA